MIFISLDDIPRMYTVIKKRLTESSDVSSILSTFPRVLRDLFLFLTRLHVLAGNHSTLLAPVHTPVSEKKVSRNTPALLLPRGGMTKVHSPS